MWKSFYRSLTFRIPLLVVAAAATGAFIALELWAVALIAGWVAYAAIGLLYKTYHIQQQRVATMLDAVENADYTFSYPEAGGCADEQIVNRSLNRIFQILAKARIDAEQREKYYELIMNSINSGVMVIDAEGFVYQINREALRLLGLAVCTHVGQLGKVDARLAETIRTIQPATRHQVTFANERGTVQLQLRTAGMALHGRDVRIIAINDINTELDDREIDSWIRLTRVLTHEIMNAITPITSLGETLMSRHADEAGELRDGLRTICETGRSLISFVDSYRRFMHIPTPVPGLFYVKPFVERMVRLAYHDETGERPSVGIEVRPDDLIVYADENLISQVVVNILKNARQAIGKAPDGRIRIRAAANEADAVRIEISNNGPTIPADEAAHIFVPFFTTKTNGSGIGLSVSRQIMRLSGGHIIHRSTPNEPFTTHFTLEFP